MNFRGVPRAAGRGKPCRSPAVEGHSTAGCMAPEAEHPLGTETHGSMAAIPQN